MTREEAVFSEFGAELRAARTEQNRSIDEVAAATKIHRRYIDAIEAGDMNALPQGPYVKAFLREYARAVGLKVPAEFASPGAVASTATRTPPPSSPKRNSPTTEPEQKSEKRSSLDPIKLTRDTAKFANQAARSAAQAAVKTTESVIKTVESGAQGAVGVLTSKSLWAEAEQVRRARLGLAPTPESLEQSKSVPPAPTDAREIRQIIESTTLEAKPLETTPSVHDIPSSNAVASEPEVHAVEASPVVSLSRYEDDVEQPRKKKRAVATTGSGSGWLSSTTNQVILGLVVIFALVAYFAISTNRKQRTSEELNRQLAQEEVDVAKSDVHTEAPKSEPVKPIAKAPNDTGSGVTAPVPAASSEMSFTLKAKDIVWVSIAADTGIAFRGELKAGDSKNFSAKDKFVINLGNQKAVDMIFNGQPLSHLPTIANSGIVVRNLVLTKDRVSLNGQSESTNPQAPTTPKSGAPSTTNAPKGGANVNGAVTPHSATNAVKPGVALPKSGTPAKPTTTSVKPGTTNAAHPGTSTNGVKPSSTVKNVQTANGGKPSVAAKPGTKPAAKPVAKPAPKKSAPVRTIEPVAPMPARP